ncbi:flagellar basal body rod protein FlgG [Paenibacillus sp. FJAT-26967]|uniref:flagellar basal body rod protein FlgG n=1 Tax=Paenibacillus sp. FJAT-26967 TaxID=1729690 RepID=UPI00083832CD|nr:flagellar basal body rod protein FlgG [Paenibacillus sp. FJAT-26967]
MLRSMYSGISGMRGFQTKLDVIGNNIANVNTAGFKKGRVNFSDIMSQTVSGSSAPSTDPSRGGINAKQIGLGSSISSIDTIHTGGSAMTTNVPTDLRIDGNGFFAVSTGGGDEPIYLTRAGNFTIDANRHIVNPDGMYLLSTDREPIQLAENATKFSISQDGSIIEVIEGIPVVSPYKISVVKVANPAGLEKIGGNLYDYTLNADTFDELAARLGESLAADPATGTGSIITGQLEMSNVDLTEEFSEMIVSQRGFQANSRIITTSDEILQEIVNLKR